DRGQGRLQPGSAMQRRSEVPLGWLSDRWGASPSPVSLDRARERNEVAGVPDHWLDHLPEWPSYWWSSRALLGSPPRRLRAKLLANTRISVRRSDGERAHCGSPRVRALADSACRKCRELPHRVRNLPAVP